MLNKLRLGLTKAYNQFHNKELPAPEGVKTLLGLSPKEIEKKYGKNATFLWKHLEKTKGTCSFHGAVAAIFKLRELHKQINKAVLAAYGWDKPGPDGPAIQLDHDFYEVDYLPENDRLRYTISPQARKEVLKRLLLLNHKIHEEEVEKGLWGEKKRKNRAGMFATGEINLCIQCPWTPLMGWKYKFQYPAKYAEMSI